MLESGKKPRKSPAVKPVRVRLNERQREFLEVQFQQKAHWDNDEIEELAKQVGVSFAKVYKWNWERKKKERQVVSSEITMNELARIYPRVTQLPLEI